MSLTQAGGGHHSGQSGHHGDGQQSGHTTHSHQTGHHNLGNLSNGNMSGSYYQYWNFSHFLEGLRINTGLRFAILFIAFTGWLYIIYWIRHHEPFTNQVIGVKTTLAPTAAQDRSLVAQIRKAFPFRTSPNMGILYVPSPQAVQPPQISQPRQISQSTEEHWAFNTGQVRGKPTQIFENKMANGAAQAVAAPISYPQIDIDQRFGSPANTQLSFGQPISSSSIPIESYNQHQYNSDLLHPNQASGIYQIKVNNGKSNLLRTIVSR